jgi:hypothetical protein
MMLKKRDKKKKKFMLNKIFHTLYIITTHRILKTEREINCKLKAHHMLKKIQ